MNALRLSLARGVASQRGWPTTMQDVLLIKPHARQHPGPQQQQPSRRRLSPNLGTTELINRIATIHAPFGASALFDRVNFTRYAAPPPG